MIGVRQSVMSTTPEYNAWRAMKRRCFNPQDEAFHLYGGRGITVCDRWKRSPTAFIADMGPKPSPRHTLDRIDNNRGYEPSNCAWRTPRQNCRNRRSTLFVVYQGQRRALIELCDERGLRAGSVQWRLANGWTLDDALATAPWGRGKGRPSCSKSITGEAAP